MLCDNFYWLNVIVLNVFNFRYIFGKVKEFLFWKEKKFLVKRELICCDWKKLKRNEVREDVEYWYYV